MSAATEPHSERKTRRRAASARGRRVGWPRRTALAVGGVLLALGLAALGYELWLAAQVGGYRPIAAGELWFRLDVGSLNLSQAVIQRYVHPWLWEPAIVSVLRLPAWLVLGLPGLVLVVIGWPRRV